MEKAAETLEEIYHEFWSRVPEFRGDFHAPAMWQEFQNRLYWFRATTEIPDDQLLQIIPRRLAGRALEIWEHARPAVHADLSTFIADFDIIFGNGMHTANNLAQIREITRAPEETIMAFYYRLCREVPLLYPLGTASTIWQDAIMVRLRFGSGQEYLNSLHSHSQPEPPSGVWMS